MDELLDAIAHEAARGRLLLVATTDLDDEETVVWNMGEIAAQGGESGRRLFRDVLVASSSIPGLFPPVLIPVEQNGVRYEEMHADGALATPFLAVPEGAFVSQFDGALLRGAHIYVIVNGQTGRLPLTTPLRNGSIMTKSLSAAFNHTSRTHLALTAAFAQHYGIAFRFTEIPLDHPDVALLDFSASNLEALFDFGLRCAEDASEDARVTGPAALRLHRVAAARRRRARRLPGRRLSGSIRGVPASGLGRRHLDWRDQLGADRRQPARGTGREAARVLGPRDFAAPMGRSAVLCQQRVCLVVGRCDTSRSAWGARASLGEPDEFRCCRRARRTRFLRAARAHSVAATDGDPGSDQLLRDGATQGDARSLVDFDRINAGEMRFSVGAVNVGTGNFVYFDNSTHVIGAEHVMASAALPPGLPAIEIEGEFYWDGGLVSNTPLQWVLESEPRQDTLAFQVDLWNARGTLPRTMAEVMTRQKEIQYSSRTRANSDRFKHTQQIRNTLASLLQKLPADLVDSHEYAVLKPIADHAVYNLVQLVYRSKQYEAHSKDYEFSHASMEEHWRAGYHDAIRTLRHPEVLERPASADGLFTFDLGRDGRE
jgi:predicted acylesterase/phospholipase RssA